MGGVRRGQSSVIQLMLSPAALPTQWISSWALSIHCSEAAGTVGESGLRTGEDTEGKVWTQMRPDRVKPFRVHVAGQRVCAGLRVFLIFFFFYRYAVSGAERDRGILDSMLCPRLSVCVSECVLDRDCFKRAWRSARCRRA